MTWKLSIVIALVVGSLAVVAPAAGDSMFRYQRNDSLIYGQIRDECGYECMTNWYRAGSGLGKDQCDYNNWIPLGTYNVQFHVQHYDAEKVKGRVWYLGNYYCGNGVTRSELFVHTEELADNTETCGDPYYDQRWCWDGEGDYYSEGCIKVARLPVHSNGYSDIGFLNYWASWYPVDFVEVDA